MASIDLKDAYYSVPIWEAHRKFLRFGWEGQLWQFDCKPNSLALAPRKFTKLLKLVFATLRERGHLSTAILDDTLLSVETEMSCAKNIRYTKKLLQSLGFIVYPEKLFFELTALEKVADIIASYSKAMKKSTLPPYLSSCLSVYTPSHTLHSSSN